MPMPPIRSGFFDSFPTQVYGEPITLAITAISVGLPILVAAIKRGQVNRQQAIALAEKLGIPDAAEVPGFVARVMKMSPDKIAKVRARLAGKSSKKSKSKLAVLDNVSKLKSAMRSGKEPMADYSARVDNGMPDPDLQAAGVDTAPAILPWAIGGAAAVAAVVLAVLAMRKRKS